MSERSDTLTDGLRWGSRLAVVGILIAALSLAISAVGIGSANPLYWAGVFLSIIAVTGAAIRGARTTDTDGDGVPDSEEGTTDTDGDGTPDSEEEYSVVRHAGGVISAMVGVFVIGFGVENGNLLIILAGVGVLIVGVLGVIFDTQRTE
ncbi:hypothetical protein [Haloarchaeobius sp. FL176]|uniref:hypothetical protein n=1 Tax=Haloarchaeobius sp. FL176 TaxID=2967129 RepID=UPI0021485EFF|nr:hypothetical protein [Haloarchaeobius sp. FL176]